MIWVGNHTRGDKVYRWAVERKQSGRPIGAQFQKPDGTWADVRNIDVLDGIWNVSNGLPFEHDHRKGQ